MRLALPKPKTIVEQLTPALIAVAVVALGTVLIPTRYPVEVSNGVINPHIVRPGDVVEIRWRQEWRRLCPLTVTREFVGVDGFKKTSTRMTFEAPSRTGVHEYSGHLVVPDLPVGAAYYHSLVEPHCLVDLFWQRSYRTPEVPITVAAGTPSGSK